MRKLPEALRKVAEVVLYTILGAGITFSAVVLMLMLDRTL